jgi:hypothetical protein
VALLRNAYQTRVVSTAEQAKRVAERPVGGWTLPVCRQGESVVPPDYGPGMAE